MPALITLPDSWGRWFLDSETYDRAFLGLTHDASRIVAASKGALKHPRRPDMVLELAFASNEDAIEFKLKNL